MKIHMCRENDKSSTSFAIVIFQGVKAERIEWLEERSKKRERRKKRMRRMRRAKK